MVRLQEEIDLRRLALEQEATEATEAISESASQKEEAEMIEQLRVKAELERNKKLEAQNAHYEAQQR